MVKNAWGERVKEVKGDPWYTPKRDRLPEDDPQAPDANALDGGDDLDGWDPSFEWATKDPDA